MVSMIAITILMHRDDDDDWWTKRRQGCRTAVIIDQDIMMIIGRMPPRATKYYLISKLEYQLKDRSLKRHMVSSSRRSIDDIYYCEVEVIGQRPRRGWWPKIPHRVSQTSIQTFLFKAGNNCSIWNRRSLAPPGPLPKKERSLCLFIDRILGLDFRQKMPALTCYVHLPSFY